LDAIDAMDGAFDTQQENLNKIDDLLQHDMEILQLVHGEENYDEMTLLWQQQIDQDNKRLVALQKEQQYCRKQDTNGQRYGFFHPDNRRDRISQGQKHTVKDYPRDGKPNFAFII
jgi:alpha-acetolactate decarboxylase